MPLKKLLGQPPGREDGRHYVLIQVGPTEGEGILRYFMYICLCMYPIVWGPYLSSIDAKSSWSGKLFF